MTLAKSFFIYGWRIQPPLNRMTREGRVIQFEPRVMQVLCKLAEHPGEVFTRADLLDSVWQGVIVGEEALTRAISELRKAFGDDPKRPKIIETIYKSGYRLLAPVEAGASSSALTSTPLRPSFLRIGSIAAVFVAMGAFVAVVPIISLNMVRGEPGNKTGSEFDLALLTSFPGEELFPALSPEGETVVFSWRRPGGLYNSLMSKSISADEARVLLSGDNAHYVNAAWAPDGDSLAFVRRNDDACEIMDYDMNTRELSVLTPCSTKSWPYLAWRPDGKALLYSDRKHYGAPYQLFELSLHDGMVAPITSPPAHVVGDRHIAYAADGRSIAFLRVNAYGISDIYLKSFADKQETQITFDNVKIAGLAWSAENEIVFSSNRRGEWDLWKVDVSSQKLSPVSLGADAYGVSLSQHSQRLAFEVRSVDIDIWRADLNTPENSPRAFIESTQWDDEPAFSRSGDEIAFASDRSGAPEIWIAGAQHGSVRRLTHFDGGLIIHPRWSPDDKFIVFNARVGGNSDIYSVNVESGIVKKLTHHEAIDATPEWSNDGKSIVFSSNRSGAWQLWQLVMDDANRLQQLTTHGGIAPRPVENGVFHMFTDREGVWFLEKNSGQSVSVPGTNSIKSFASWGASENIITYLKQTSEGPIELYRLDTQTGEVTPIASNLGISDSELNYASFSISPNGTELLYSKVEARNSDLMLLDMAAGKQPNQATGLHGAVALKSK